jgi:hypothetical protein
MPQEQVREPPQGYLPARGIRALVDERQLPAHQVMLGAQDLQRILQGPLHRSRPQQICRQGKVAYTRPRQRARLGR